MDRVTMPNSMTFADSHHAMSMRIRRYVSSSIGSFRDRSRSRNRRRTYNINGVTSENSSRNSVSSSQPDLTYQSQKRRSQIVDVRYLYTFTNVSMLVDYFAFV